jgi:hypothetical protein
MNEIHRRFPLVVWVGLLHCLLTFVVGPNGHQYLFGWESPHWVRALFAAVFGLPLIMVFGQYLVFHAPLLIFLLIPLNSLLFSCLIITPFCAFQRFRLTGERRDLVLGSSQAAFSAALLSVIGILYIPPNILSQREVTRQVLAEIDAATRQVEITNTRPIKP